MKMSDGGFRPVYNVQFATTCQEQVIVGMRAVNAGSDMGQLLQPMVKQVKQRVGQAPAQWLVDGGFPAHEQLDAVAGTPEAYAPVSEPRQKKDADGQLVPQDKHHPKKGDSQAVVQWRARMGGERAKEIYKQRAVVGLFVLAHNLMRMVKLAPRLLDIGTGASAMVAQGA